MLIRAKDRDRALIRDASGAEVFKRIGFERIAGRLRSTRSIISLNSPYALGAFCAHNVSSILNGRGGCSVEYPRGTEGVWAVW